MNMNLNFEWIIFCATVITGVIALIDSLFLAKRRSVNAAAQHGVMLTIIDYSRSFFPILLIVFILRSFLFEPFRIPSGSLEPTLQVGDFIIVNKYKYGVRLPIVHDVVANVSKPQRGDIMVFRFPPNPSVNYIKRVIGLPGDHISYVNKELTVNGVKVPQAFLKSTMVDDDSGKDWLAQEKQEDLLGVKHNIFVNNEKSSLDYKDIIVPEGMYFMMGDNRDDSQDSRYWGFVPEANIVGKAQLVWMSWNGLKEGYSLKSIKDMVRWDRLGKVVR